MKQATDWKDYEIIATGNGLKLERWSDVYLLRPDPQIIWDERMDMYHFPKLNARYNAFGMVGEKWDIIRPVPDEFTVSRKGLTFSLKLMKGFKHTGLFPEQAANWDEMQRMIRAANRPIKVLNLFAYTGGATMACLQAGASVTHVDAAQSMVQRAKRNAELSSLADKPCRYIIDDCVKFVNREIRRGNVYDAIIMDPPSFGRGPNGELWKLEDKLFEFIQTTKQVLSDKPLFYLINSYTTGLQPTVIDNLLKITFGNYKGESEAYELTLPTREGIALPCGCSGLYRFE
ncbi:MAG: class I SAM-dependent methyltransferase [Clostridia bacterium]|nr:class I SAM-dependent methyltransferase [Clostridia bacterium]